MFHSIHPASASRRLRPAPARLRLGKPKVRCHRT